MHVGGQPACRHAPANHHQLACCTEPAGGRHPQRDRCLPDPAGEPLASQLTHVQRNMLQRGGSELQICRLCVTIVCCWCLLHVHMCLTTVLCLLVQARVLEALEETEALVAAPALRMLSFVSGKLLPQLTAATNYMPASQVLAARTMALG